MVDDVAVLGYALPIGRACDRQINLAPDDLTPNPVESSGGLPPLRNTKYTYIDKRKNVTKNQFNQNNGTVRNMRKFCSEINKMEINYDFQLS